MAKAIGFVGVLAAGIAAIALKVPFDRIEDCAVICIVFVIMFL